MNDYWNDPPDEPELPECPAEGCDGFCDVVEGLDNGAVLLMQCEECGAFFVMENPHYYDHAEIMFGELPNNDEN